MSNRHYAYSFNNVTCIVGATEIRGFADGDGIIIEYETDNIADESGADGDTVITLISDNRATITIRLLQESQSNEVFSALNVGYRTGTIIPTPFLVKDSTGNDLHTSFHVTVMNKPSITYGKQSNVVEWRLRAPALLSYVGGGLRLG